MNEIREKIDRLVTFARQREAATRLPDCIPGAEQRLQQAKSELLALIAPVMEENERLRTELGKACDALEVALEPWHGAAKANGQRFIQQTRAALSSSEKHEG
jgi:hypothetical protein